jgi:uncharacterized protein YndB with AHSA1/START domain
MSPERNERSRSTAARPAAIRVTRRFNAPAERVFEAWLAPELAGRWLFAKALQPMTDVAIDSRVGGSFRFADPSDGQIVEYTGQYVGIAPHRRLVFTLSAADHPRVVTRVTVEISPLKTGCELALTHEHVPLEYASQTEARWTGILYGLGETLSSPGVRAGAESGRARGVVAEALSLSMRGCRPRRDRPALGDRPTSISR